MATTTKTTNDNPLFQVPQADRAIRSTGSHAGGRAWQGYGGLGMENDGTHPCIVPCIGEYCYDVGGCGCVTRIVQITITSEDSDRFTVRNGPQLAQTTPKNAGSKKSSKVRVPKGQSIPPHPLC